MAAKKGKYQKRVEDTVREVVGGSTGTKVGRIAERFAASLGAEQRKVFLDTFPRGGDLGDLERARKAAGGTYSVAAELGTQASDDRKVSLKSGRGVPPKKTARPKANPAR